jgi:hypothetical protein
LVVSKVNMSVQYLQSKMAAQEGTEDNADDNQASQHHQFFLEGHQIFLEGHKFFLEGHQFFLEGHNFFLARQH